MESEWAITVAMSLFEKMPNTVEDYSRALNSLQGVYMHISENIRFIGPYLSARLDARCTASVDRDFIAHKRNVSIRAESAPREASCAIAVHDRGLGIHSCSVSFDRLASGRRSKRLYQTRKTDPDAANIDVAQTCARRSGRGGPLLWPCPRKTW